jgi:hypothetical protein
MPWGQFFTFVGQVAIVIFLLFIVAAMISVVIDHFNKRN